MFLQGTPNKLHAPQIFLLYWDARGDLLARRFVFLSAPSDFKTRVSTDSGLRRRTFFCHAAKFARSARAELDCAFLATGAEKKSRLFGAPFFNNPLTPKTRAGYRRAHRISSIFSSDREIGGLPAIIQPLIFVDFARRKGVPFVYSSIFRFGEFPAPQRRQAKMSALQLSTLRPAAAPAPAFPLHQQTSTTPATLNGVASRATGPIAQKDAYLDGPRVGPEELPLLRETLKRKNFSDFKALVGIFSPHAVVDPMARWHDMRVEGSLYALAASHNWVEAIEWLAVQGADPSINTLAAHPILQALLGKNKEALDALLKIGANPSTPAFDGRFGGLPKESCTLEDMQGKLRREARLGWLDWQIISHKLTRGTASQCAIRSACACFALDFPRAGDAEFWAKLGSYGWRPSEHDKTFMQMAYFQAKNKNYVDIQEALVALGLEPDESIARPRLEACLVR